MKESKGSEFNLAQEFINYWQNFIQEWLKFAKQQNENLKEFIETKDEFIKYGSIYKSVPNYFPEPYLGNPNNISNNRIHAVFINLNPGGAGSSQSYYEKGGYIKDLDTNGNNYLGTLNSWTEKFYSEIKVSDKKKITAYGTLNWWNKYRAGWINSFLKPPTVNYEIGIENILGLELSPWHSRKFTDIGNIDYKFVMENVVDKAVLFSKQINNPFLRIENYSIVLTCGSGFKSFFKNETWMQVTPAFLKRKWNVWVWKYDEETSIINFHQVDTKGPVKLNFPNDPAWEKEIQDFLSDHLKAMLK